ncbi:MAG: phosphate ABC transporter permease subunit PstC [Clostridiales bacterium]|nr:phosphate ABC transporter permease subunit PstC [Clostridiales bacterium]
MNNKSERIMAAVFFVCGITAIAAVFAICVYMISSGVPALAKIGVIDMLFGTKWAPTASEPGFGILYIILTSIVGTLLAIIIGVPIALLTAVFLAEIAPKGLSRVVKPAVELLAGIPSVVYGLLGILIIKPIMYRIETMIYAGDPSHQMTGGANLISAVFVLAVMILPTVVNVSETAIRAVPQHLRNSSYALGATKITTVFKVTIPAAKSGIITSIVLGVGRAIGEAMAITMVAGNVVNLPMPFNSVRFLTTGIVSEMSYSSGLHRQALFTIGLVLFVFIMVINIILNTTLKKAGEDE